MAPPIWALVITIFTLLHSLYHFTCMYPFYHLVIFYASINTYHFYHLFNFYLPYTIHHFQIHHFPTHHFTFHHFTTSVSTLFKGWRNPSKATSLAQNFFTRAGNHLTTTFARTSEIGRVYFPIRCIFFQTWFLCCLPGKVVRAKDIASLIDNDSLYVRYGTAALPSTVSSLKSSSRSDIEFWVSKCRLVADKTSVS